MIPVFSDEIFFKKRVYRLCGKIIESNGNYFTFKDIKGEIKIYSEFKLSTEKIEIIGVFMNIIYVKQFHIISKYEELFFFYEASRYKHHHVNN